MSSFKKTILICASAAVLIIAGIFIVHSFSTPAIQDELKLKAPKDRILSVEQVDDVRCNDDGTNCVNLGKIEKYQYVSDIEVPPVTYEGLQEDITQRTSNAQFFKQGQNGDQEQWVAKFYPQQSFYKDEKQNKWFQTETATTTIVAFNSQTKLSFWEKLLGKSALAVSYYAGAGDGNCFYNVDPATWAVAHASSTCSTVNYTGATFNIAAGGRLIGTTGFRIYRGFIPIDTSAIPSSAIISSSTLYLYLDGVSDNDNDGDDWVAVVQTSQVNSASLVIEDFDQAGAVTNPTEGSDRVDLTSMTASRYQTWTLTSTGLNWIKKSGETSNCGTTAGVTCLGIREGHDAIDSAYAVALYTNITAIASEQAGTANDPYLAVVYSYYHRTIINRPETNYLTNGLVGNWSFNGPDINNYTNSAYDRSSSYATGTMTNMATTTRAVPGISGSALKFDGVDDQVSLSDNSVFTLTAANNYSWSFWINPDSIGLGSDSYRTIWVQGIDPNNYVGIYAETTTDSYWGPATNAIVAVWYNSATANSIRHSNDDAISLNKKQHVVVTYDGSLSAASRFSIYVNGVDVSNADTQSDGTPSDQNPVVIWIGSNQLAGGSFDGMIDEVRFYNRALSLSEIASLYRAGAARMKINTPAPAPAGSTSGLVGYWSFNGPDMNWGTNTAYDRSGQNNNGTMLNMSTTTSPTIGKSGSGLKFDGVDDYVDAGNASSLNPTNQITMSFWTYLKSRKWQYFIEKEQTVTPFATQYFVRIYTSGFGVFSTQAGINFVGNTTPSLNAWHHVVVTFDGSFGRLYLDGVLDNTPDDQTGPMSDNGMNVTIGNSPLGYSSYGLDGLMDEVRIYNRALSPSEIQELYEMGTRTVKVKTH